MEEIAAIGTFVMLASVLIGGAIWRLATKIEHLATLVSALEKDRGDRWDNQKKTNQSLWDGINGHIRDHVKGAFK